MKSRDDSYNYTTIRTLAAVTLIHLLLWPFVCGFAMWLTFSAASITDPVNHKIADAMIIAYFLPVVIPDRLGIPILSAGLHVAIPMSTAGWCLASYAFIVARRALRRNIDRVDTKEADPRDIGDDIL